MSDLPAAYQAIVDELGGPQHEVHRPGDRWALIERYVNGNVHVSSHPSPTAAAAYNAEQEDVGWWPETLVDLETGERHGGRQEVRTTFDGLDP